MFTKWIKKCSTRCLPGWPGGLDIVVGPVGGAWLPLVLRA